MRQSLAKFSESEASNHTPSLADFTTTTPELKFSVHTGTMEAVFTTASKGASEYTAKLIEFLKANTTSTLDFAQELFGVKTPAEATELWTSHSRKSFETFSAQAKELAELGQKVATETVKPIKTSASKYYQPAA